MSLNAFIAAIGKRPQCLWMTARKCYSCPVIACSKHIRQCQPFITQRRQYSNGTETISPPQLEDDAKVYEPKIRRLVEEIGQLTLVEVADLNELLKKTLNITDTPMMAMGAMPATAAPVQEEEPEVKEEKVVFTVRLTKFDTAKKVALIKEIKNQLEGMNLVQSKKFVESLPQDVKKDIPKDEAEKLKAALEAAGGVAEID